MGILIDGYNLLHASGILGRGVGPGGLERSRRALLNFLLGALTPEEIATTAVVFDAPEHGSSGPRQGEHEGITVYFSSGYEDADSLIEEMIQRDNSPRGLVVVSSDHRIQRAARRRRCTAVDSEVWHAELVRQRREQQTGNAAQEAKPMPPGEGEVAFWLEQFSEDPPTDGENQRPPKPSPHDPFPPDYFYDLGDEL
jgi:predicted RNA-binding protein with PIN domain